MRERVEGAVRSVEVWIRRWDLRVLTRVLLVSFFFFSKIEMFG